MSNRDSIKRDSYEQDMDYLVDLWLHTNTVMPTVRQLNYVEYLCQVKDGADTSFWDQKMISKRQMGSIIHKLVQLPDKERYIAHVPMSTAIRTAAKEGLSA